MHLGFDFMKSRIIFDIAGLLDQPNALTEGSGRLPFLTFSPQLVFVRFLSVHF